MERSKKIIIATAVHGRTETVRYCFNQMPFVDKVATYTNERDRSFLESFDMIKTSYSENSPLSLKWNNTIKSLKDVDFDAVILLGADDFIDERFIDFIDRNIDGFDMIAFRDMYFKQDQSLYYWEGYSNYRNGEPSGAGKTYSRDFLELIDFDLFPQSRDNGLDGMSWKVCQQARARILVTSLRENDLFCCDVKDGEGITPLRNIPDLIKIK